MVKFNRPTLEGDIADLIHKSKILLTTCQLVREYAASPFYSNDAIIMGKNKPHFYFT